MPLWWDGIWPQTEINEPTEIWGREEFSGPGKQKRQRLGGESIWLSWRDWEEWCRRDQTGDNSLAIIVSCKYSKIWNEKNFKADLVSYSYFSSYQWRKDRLWQVINCCIIYSLHYFQCPEDYLVSTMKSWGNSLIELDVPSLIQLGCGHDWNKTTHSCLFLFQTYFLLTFGYHLYEFSEV